jgi:arabinogalactan oligomer / maltooligosaccharide transport system permease protein
MTSGLLVKLVLLAGVDALLLFGAQRMAQRNAWGFLTTTVVFAVIINVVFLQPRLVALKYMLPGTIFLLVVFLYPVGYTIYNSFTNYGTAHNLTKGQALEQIIKNSVLPASQGQHYALQVMAKGDPASGELAFLLTDDSGVMQLGTRAGLAAVDPSTVEKTGTKVSKVGDYVSLRLGDSNRRKAEIDAFRVPSPNGEIQDDGFTSALVKQLQFRYDTAKNTIIDTVDGTIYRDRQGAFVSDTGHSLDPGWSTVVGVDNYKQIFTDKSVSGPFLRVFLWTFAFALFSVLLSFGLGLLLAIVFNDARMRGQKIYRSLMIIPYALPSFMTILVWRGMMNQRFGALNHFLHTNIPWLDEAWTARGSILLVNMWLGFPYMFLVCTGALQSIPKEMTESAIMDGATGVQRFKRVTMPLLLVAVAPLLIASFAFNFNNFNVIYLLTEGRPAIIGSNAGQTDILISYTYKLAFGGSQGAQYGFASAVSVIIFVLIGAISAVSFRKTKSFEEIR